MKTLEKLDVQSRDCCRGLSLAGTSHPSFSLTANTYPTYYAYGYVATPSGGTLYSTFNMPSVPFNMTTYPMRDSAGTTFAFEIDNVAITPSKAAAVLRSIDGVSDVKPRRIFRRPTDIHVRFRYGGVAFVVWEPYADSNRYWIGPQDDKQEHIEIGVVEAAFNRYSPPMIFRVLGNLLALRLTFKDS